MKSILMTLSFSFIAFSIYAAEVRPLSLTVLDAETGEPIPNVPVYYKLTSASRERFLLLFYKIDPVIYRTLTKKSCVTDDQGRVMLDGNVVSLKKHEKLLKETIYINIDAEGNTSGKYDANDFFSSAHVGRLLCNPVTNYIGAIVTATGPFTSDEQCGVTIRKDVIFESIFADNSLSKKSDAIEIQLKKAATSTGSRSSTSP